MNVIDEIDRIIKETVDGSPVIPESIEIRGFIDFRAASEDLDTEDPASEVEEAELFAVVFEAEDEEGSRLRVDVYRRPVGGIILTLSGQDDRGRWSDLAIFLDREQSLKLARALVG